MYRICEFCDKSIRPSGNQARVPQDVEWCVCRFRSQKRYNKKHPAKTSPEAQVPYYMRTEYFRNRQMAKKYGMTPEDYEEMLDQQGKVCAICGGIQKGRRLAIDHCHFTDKVRGLLCTNCNLGLGNFRDNPKYLTSAISYLSRALEGG